MLQGALSSMDTGRLLDFENRYSAWETNLITALNQLNRLEPLSLFFCALCYMHECRRTDVVHN